MQLPQFLKPKNELEAGGRQSVPVHRDENEMTKQCPNCRRQVPLSLLWSQHNTCSCGYHFRMNARQRVNFLADEGTFRELDRDLVGTDVLGFPGYPAKLETTRSATGEVEAVLCGTAEIQGAACCLFVMDPYFMMGSMGWAVGEKMITRLFEYATEQRLPVVGCTVSGGARMQEGLVSLMQMAKTSAALRRHSAAGLFYLVLLTDPTTGGVMASFAMDGDVILAEPGATIGFAGAPVRKKLPQGFQKAEFLLEHGFVDAVVPRNEQRETISLLLNLHQGGGV